MKDETRVREEYEKKLSDPAFLMQRLAEITGAEVVLSKPPEPEVVPPPIEEEPKTETFEPETAEIPVEVEDDGNLEGKDDETPASAPRPRPKKR
jgi:hypothetical protein